MPGSRLTADEREEIALGLATERSFADITRQLDRPTSTVAREVDRNGGRRRYRATRAQRETDRRARRPKQRRLVGDRRLAREVTKRLTKRHSPEQIANRLRLEHADEPHWWVSHETIYQALYLQGRGGLRAELTEALRTGRARRRRKGPNPGRGTRGRIKDMVEISERPAAADDRAVPGHWEGDLILGRAGKSRPPQSWSERPDPGKRTSPPPLLIYLPGLGPGPANSARRVAEILADEASLGPGTFAVEWLDSTFGALGDGARIIRALVLDVLELDYRPRLVGAAASDEDNRALLHQLLLAL